MVYFLLADGFEEAEALVPFDMLRRAGKECKLVSVYGQKTVSGSHGINVSSDISFDEIDRNDMEMLVLPGGMPGTSNLDKFDRISELLEYAFNNCFLCAICAAPSVLGKRGLLRNKKVTCYPGYEEFLDGADYTDKPCVIDGNIITGKAAGAAYEFGLMLVSALCGSETSDKIRRSIYL